MRLFIFNIFFHKIEANDNFEERISSKWILYSEKIHWIIKSFQDDKIDSSSIRFSLFSNFKLA